jgi:hypothetical protein
MDGYRNPSNGRAHGEYTWCSQCEQVHRTSEWERRAWYCPAACGATGLDALPWEFVRQVNLAYPRHPVTGRHYTWQPRPAVPARREEAWEEAELQLT